MSKAHFILKPGIGAESKIIIDGHDIANTVSSIQISMRAGGAAEITLEIFIRECQIDSDGMVILNGCDVPDNLARQFYCMLRERFKDNAENTITEEREACANVCESFAPWGDSADDWAAECLRSAARAIRNRSKEMS